MKRQIFTLASFLILAGLTFAQQTPTAIPSELSSYGNGVFFAPNFGRWTLQIAPGSGVTATGSQTILVNAAQATTPDGLLFVPFAVNGKITVGTGTTAEIVTISAVSGCTPGAALAGTTATCSVTATSYANNHSGGEPITSGDAGIMEAIAFAGNAAGLYGTGGAQVYFQVDCGVITLSTGGTTTTSTCFVPNLFYNQGAAARVSTTITTATTWQLGVLGFLTAFTGSNSTMTAGTTAFTTQGAYAMNLSTGATTNGLVAVLVTTTGTPGAGAIKAKVWGYVPVQPAF